MPLQQQALAAVMYTTIRSETRGDMCAKGFRVHFREQASVSARVRLGSSQWKVP